MAYVAFAAAHLRVLMVTSAKLKVMGEEIGERLQRDAQGFTDYPRSLAAILHISFDRRAIVIIHLTIDLCVVAIIAAAASLFPV
jgi:hypothetical protein